MKTAKTHTSIDLRQRALFVVALVMVMLRFAYAEQPTSGISFAQISFTSPEAPQKYSRYGQISIDYTMLYGDGYINVERYNNGQAAGWVVRNLPVTSRSLVPGYSTTFDLGASGYQQTLGAYVDFSPSPMAADSSLINQTPVTYKLGQAEYPLPVPTVADHPCSSAISNGPQTATVGCNKKMEIYQNTTDKTVQVTVTLTKHDCKAGSGDSATMEVEGGPNLCSKNLHRWNAAETCDVAPKARLLLACHGAPPGRGCTVTWTATPK